MKNKQKQQCCSRCSQSITFKERGSKESRWGQILGFSSFDFCDTSRVKRQYKIMWFKVLKSNIISKRIYVEKKRQ